MLMTVVICTRNRALSLRRALRSIELAGKPDCDWEMLVVDNGSNDATQTAINSFKGRLPLRCEVEPLAGLSNARNTAVLSAQGKYIVWTDDDVVVEQGWLIAYVTAFNRWPHAAIFGGRVVPVLTDPAVAWFQSVIPIIGYALAARDLGPVPIPMNIEGDVIPYGANFAVRTAEQRQFPYDPELGVAPGRRRLGEETSVIKAMLGAGYSGMWVPESGVKHIIGHDRQTIQYVADYFEAHGATELQQSGRPTGALTWGVPNWLWRRALTRLFSYLLSRFASSPEVWVKKLIMFAQDRGKIKYLLERTSVK
jgi:glycosyltransferase involved in cell wall biosynthesis